MIREVLTGYLTSFSSPEILILIGIVGVFFFQNMKETSLRKMILGESEDSPLVLSFKQIIYGLFGGLIISLLARCLNLQFHFYGEVQMVFFLTIFTLTKLSPYVNVGVNILVVFLVEILLGDPSGFILELPTLYFFVGMSKMIEALIILLDHNFGFTPLLFAKGKSVRGGFRMNKTYLFPISAGFFAASGAILGQSVFYYLLYPMFSVKEVFTSFTKKEATLVISSLKMICGSLILFLTLGTLFYEEIIYVLLVISPLLIVGEVYFFRRIEKIRDPRFISMVNDVVVLDVRKNSNAYHAGLRSGHRVISMNRRLNPTYDQLVSNMILPTYSREIDLRVKDVSNKSISVTFQIEENQVPGILFVPPSESFELLKESD